MYSYSYDKAGRIQKVEAPGKTTVYTYDRSGNRITQDETYASEQTIPCIDGMNENEIKYIIKKSEYVYSNSNRMLKLVEKLQDGSGKELLQKVMNYRYDNNGNQLRQTTEYIIPSLSTYAKTYSATVYSENTTEPVHKLVEQVSNSFDAFNRLVKAESVKAGVRTTVEYSYNGDDLRIQKTVRSSDKGNTAEITNFLYDRQHVILETDGSGNETVRYIKGINYIARVSGGSPSYYLYNGHGDVVQTVSESGEVENSYDYDIFGNPTLTIETYNEAIRYAGEYYDAETGLYYLRARYYDPYIGRFISEDSYWGEDDNPLSLNLYTYCENDPINFIDPTGHNKEAISQRISQINKEIYDLQQLWWSQVYLYNAGQKQSEWNQTQWAAHRMANVLRAEQAALERELKAAKAVDDPIGKVQNEAKSNGVEDKDKGSPSKDTKAPPKPESPEKQQTPAKPNTDIPQPGEQKAAGTGSKVSTANTAVNVLKIGDKGVAVEEVQKLLIGANITEVIIGGKTYQLEADGDFGKITQEAVKVYQRKKGLAADGIVGPQTMSKLRESNNLSDKQKQYAAILDEKQSGKGSYKADDVEAQRVRGAVVTPVDQGKGETGSTTAQKIGDYLKASGKQVILGNYTDDVTILGTAGQVGTGLLGIDLPGDIRDITYDVTNWEWTWSHAGQTTIDVIGVLPVVGAIKYTDEVGVLLKNSDEAAAALKGVGKTVKWSSGTVSDAAKQLDNGVTSVTVKSKAQAEELFLGKYQGAGYKNTTGMSATEAKNFHGTKTGTYHWDDAVDSSGRVVGHGSGNAHGELPHLQVHTPEGKIIRVFYEN